MRCRWLLLFCLVMLVSFAACDRESPLAPSASESVRTIVPDADQVARALVVSAGWPALDEQGEPIDLVTGKSGGLTFERRLIAGDVYHYSFRVPVGPGVHDVIGVHRVVREPRPGRPLVSPKSVFLVHGDYKDFVGCFVPGLNSPSTPPAQGLAPFLASQNVDVWGIDLGWALLPPEVADFSFMQTWDMQRQIDDLRVGLAVAHVARALSGNAPRPLILLGYSMGGTLGYCYLNDEAGRPDCQRLVKAYIPVDFGVKTADPDFREFICAYAGMDQERMDTGVFAYSSGFATIGDLARSEPAADSPIVPGLTNLQFALAVAAGPAFGDPFSGHFLAGEFAADGLPVGLQHVTVDRWLDFLESGVPFGSVAFELDQTRLIGDCTDLPYDDLLSQVTVPVLSVAAGGGLGQYTDHSLDLLGSADVTRLEVHTNPDPALDFGHIDLLLGNNAESLVWRPILRWIDRHTGPNGGRDDHSARS